MPWTAEQIAANILHDTAHLTGEKVPERQLAIALTWVHTLLSQEGQKLDAVNLQLDEEKKKADGFRERLRVEGRIAQATEADIKGLRLQVRDAEQRDKDGRTAYGALARDYENMKLLISEKNEEIAALKERSQGPLHGQQMEKLVKEPQTECVSCGSIVQISGDTLCRKCGGGKPTEGPARAPQICLVQIGCMGGTCGEPLPCDNHPTVLKRNCPSCGAVGPCECK